LTEKNKKGTNKTQAKFLASLKLYHYLISIRIKKNNPYQSTLGDGRGFRPNFVIKLSFLH